MKKNIKNTKRLMKNTTFENPILPDEIKKNFEDWCKIKNIPYSDNLLEAVALIFDGALSMFKEMSNPWHFCHESMPEEFTPKYSNDGHTESEYVLTWDSFYGPSVDKLWNGKWVSERRNENRITPDVCHSIVAWMEIPTEGLGEYAKL